MDRLRILLISNKCPPDYDGGFELRAFQVAEGLRNRGHHLDLVTAKYRSIYQGPRNDPPWVHRIFDGVTQSQSKTAWRYIDRIPNRIECTRVARTNIAALEQFLQGRTYDLVYCFNLERIGLATVEPVVRRGLPILWHAGDNYIVNHFNYFPKRRPGYHEALQLFAGKWFEIEKRMDYRYIAFVSEFLRQDAKSKGFVPHKSFIVPRGFDGELGWDIDRPLKDPPTFFMACRIDPQKGVHHAITAAGLLQERRPDLAWRLEINGIAHSGYINTVYAAIQEKNLDGRVTIGQQIPRSEVLQRMRSSVAFLSCAIFGEPFAGTIIESLSCGTCLIGANDGSLLEVAKHEESALVYEKHDVETLSCHMERVLVGRALRNRLALGGVRVIEQRYTLDRILELTERTFNEVLEDHKTAPPISYFGRKTSPSTALSSRSGSGANTATLTGNRT
jgi:glycosyltransferase involved in cell wall biosynthesis